MTWTNRILAALLVAAALSFLPRSAVREDDDLTRAEAEKGQLLANIERLEGEIDLLEDEVEALHMDRADPRRTESVNTEIARIAREDLNLIRDGEVVFEVVEKPR